MLYPVYVHMGDDKHAHSAQVPDFPGCFTAADDWADLPAQVQESIELYCEGEDLEIPDPSSLDSFAGNADYEDGTWIFVDVDLVKLDTRKERINLSIPVGALRIIDEYANTHGSTRSGFMVKASLAAAKAG